MNINRNYKDSIFTLLFNEKEKLRELFNAVAGTNYSEQTEIVINTLKDALFMGRINDISFIIANVLVVLIEHQSTLLGIKISPVKTPREIAWQRRGGVAAKPR